MEVKKKMNFGETILSWIKTIYTEPQSSTQVNGHICVRGAIQKKKDEFHQNIKWKSEKGIKILGVKFFLDDLRTTNWSKRIDSFCREKHNKNVIPYR